MQTSTANNPKTTAAHLSQLSLSDPCTFEFADQVVLTFAASNAPSTFTSVAATDNVCALGQPIEFKGWRLTMRGTPCEADAFGTAVALKTQVPLVKFAADLTAQMVNSSEAACRGLTGVGAAEDRLRLLQLQKSYQAAAQFLQVAQTKLDTLVQTVWVDNKDRS